MTDLTITALKLLFLLGFTLHNLEEAVWLPRWSKLAGRYHPPVAQGPFVFAVIVVSVIGYWLTIWDIATGQTGGVASYAFLGFVAMMGLNAIFPHLIATIVLRKYAPGLLTGILLNLPLAIILVGHYLNHGLKLYYLLLAMVILGVTVLPSLKYLFKLGESLISEFSKK
jgi:hypothetical protein